jgi:hypothetical protein
LHEPHVEYAAINNSTKIWFKEKFSLLITFT